eukprot:12412168-Karenia_brevis.AAC.1
MADDVDGLLVIGDEQQLQGQVRERVSVGRRLGLPGFCGQCIGDDVCYGALLCKLLEVVAP